MCVCNNSNEKFFDASLPDTTHTHTCVDVNAAVTCDSVAMRSFFNYASNDFSKVQYAANWTFEWLESKLIFSTTNPPQEHKMSSHLTRWVFAAKETLPMARIQWKCWREIEMWKKARSPKKTKCHSKIKCEKKKHPRYKRANVMSSSSLGLFSSLRPFQKWRRKP